MGSVSQFSLFHGGEKNSVTDVARVSMAFRKKVSREGSASSGSRRIRNKGLENIRSWGRSGSRMLVRDGSQNLKA